MALAFRVDFVTAFEAFASPVNRVGNVGSCQRGDTNDAKAPLRD